MKVTSISPYKRVFDFAEKILKVRTIIKNSVLNVHQRELEKWIEFKRKKRLEQNREREKETDLALVIAQINKSKEAKITTTNLQWGGDSKKINEWFRAFYE